MNSSTSFRWTGLVAPGLAILVGLTGCASEQSAPVPQAELAEQRIVAEVNGAPIYARQLDEVVRAEKLLQEARGETTGALDELELRREALDLAISGEIVYQAAREHGLVAPEEQIERQLQTLKSQFDSEAAFKAHLDEAGLTAAAVRHDAERRLLMAAYAESVTGGLTLDEQQAREIYERQKGHFTPDEEVRVAHIIVRLRPGGSDAEREAARARIDEAARRAAEGEDFAEIARELSESPFAERGGDTGYFKRGRALPEFEQKVFATEVGAISDVFETPHGFNLIKVLDRRTEAPHTFDEVQTGLFMVLAREQRDEKLREHVEELRAQADVKILDPKLAAGD